MPTANEILKAADPGYNPNAAVYGAENAVFYSHIEDRDSIKPDFQNDLEVEAFIRAIKASDFAKKNWPKFAAGQGPSVELDVQAIYLGIVGARTALDKVTGDLYLLLSPHDENFTKHVILHELSHAVDIRENGNPALRGDPDGHGPVFAGIYLVMLREFYNKAISDTLRKAFDDMGVPYVLPAYAQDRN